MSYANIYILITIVVAVFCYFVVKRSLPFVKTYFYLRKHGVQTQGYVYTLLSKDHTRGTIAAVEYTFKEKKYREKLIHDEFSPPYFLYYKKPLKILVDPDDPTRVVAASLKSVASSFLGYLLVLSFVIILFIRSVS